MNHPGGITAGSPGLRDELFPVMAGMGRQADHQALVEAARQSLKGWSAFCAANNGYMMGHKVMTPRRLVPY
jgi:hypothetical protein